MKITKAVRADIDAIMALIKEAIAVMYENGIDQWNDEYPSREIIAEDIAAKTLYKAVFDGKIAGIIVINESQSPEYRDLEWEDNNGRYIVVHRLCLHPDFQGKGLSRQFMLFAEELALKSKYTSIRLDTYTRNHIALHLYDSLDYRRAGTVSFRPGKVFQCFEKVLKTASPENR